MTNEPIRKNFWTLYVEICETHKVSFDEELTLEEAKEAYLSGDFADVIDATDTEIVAVVDGR